MRCRREGATDARGDAPLLGPAQTFSSRNLARTLSDLCPKFLGPLPSQAAATREQTRATLEEMRATLLHAQLLNTSAAPEAEPLLRALRRSRGEGGEAEAEAEAYRAWFAHLPALDPGPGETDPGEAAAAVEFVGGGGGGSSTHDEL